MTAFAAAILPAPLLADRQADAFELVIQCAKVCEQALVAEYQAFANDPQCDFWPNYHQRRAENRAHDAWVIASGVVNG